MSSGHRDVVLVLASRPRFEALVGPVPEDEDRVGRFVFVKPERARSVARWIPRARLVVSKSYTRSAANRAILSARRQGVATLLIVDGPLEWSNVLRNPRLPAWLVREGGGLYRPVIHDAIAAIGSDQARTISEWNRDRGLTCLTYANRRIWTGGSLEARGESNPKDAAPFDFLLTTARTACFGAAERHALVAAFARIAEALRASGARVLVRIFDPDLRRTVEERLPSASFDAAGSSLDALRRVRAVLGSSSSVLLEAMAHDLPVATIRFRSSAPFHETGWRIEADDAIGPTLGAMLARPREAMSRQRAILEESLARNDFFECCERFASEADTLPHRPIDDVDARFEARLLRDRGAGWSARLGRLRRRHESDPGERREAP